jgi:hypothetical protein
VRSDFWSLPYAARQAIQRGESAEYEAQQRAYSMEQLRNKVADLERLLAAANETIAALKGEAA